MLSIAMMTSFLTVGLESAAHAASAITEAATFPVSAESSGLTTLTVNPQNVGDLVIFESQLHSQSITVTGVTCPKTGAWHLAERYLDTTNGVITEEIWWAVATSTGSTTITANYSASIATFAPELVSDSFTSASPSTWSLVADSGAATGTPTATTAIAFPSVTSGAGADQLYWGYAEATQSTTAGATAGFAYSTTNPPAGNLVTSNVALLPNTSYAPTASESPAGTNTSIAAIFLATPATSYTVTFNGNGATGGSMANETASAPTALTANAFVDAGYTFAGWNTAANGTGTSYANGATYPFSASATLYAQWTPATSYTVTFNGNGATGGSMANETASAPTALTANAFTRTGYTFAGWNTAANGTGTSYANGATYPFSASATLYAQWGTGIALVSGSTSSKQVGTTGAITVTSPQNVTSSGNVLLLLVQVFTPNSVSDGTISDTKTGSWVALGQTTVSGDAQFILWQCTNPQAGVEHAVTWTPGAADTWGSLVVMAEWSGGPFTLDKMSSVLTAKSASAATPSVTPGTTGELVLASAADESGTSAWTSPTNGFTAMTTPDSANVLAYLVDSATSAIGTAWSVSPSDSGATAIFTMYSQGSTATSYTVTLIAKGGSGAGAQRPGMKWCQTAASRS
jgi:uncharacterized repeat protein (TIGR02543 family)